MREIKFRVYSKEFKKIIKPNKNGFYEDVFIGENGAKQIISLSTALKYNDDKLNLLQYTGLKDKNGKDIYEGDIVKFSNGIGFISYCNELASFQLDAESYLITIPHLFQDLENQVLELLGNIYENPELLKEQK